MILYNFPYRGPLEYDKFVLNYIQLHNVVTYLKQSIKNSAIHEYHDSINELFKLTLNNTATDIYNNFL